MQVKNNDIPLSDVRFCENQQTVQSAMDFLESVGYRCVPVLNREEGTFLGNIYLVDVYRYLLKGEGQAEDNIQYLMRDSNIMIHEEDPFINAFFDIREFPYLPVVDHDQKLVGILTHSKVIDVLQNSWGMKNGGYTITASSTVYQGALKKFVSVVTQQANIEGLLTLDDEERLFRRFVVTLSAQSVDEKKVKWLESKLENNGYRVISVQKI